MSETPTEPVAVPRYVPEPDEAPEPGLLKYYLKALWNESENFRFGAMVILGICGLIGLFLCLLVSVPPKPTHVPLMCWFLCASGFVPALMYGLHAAHVHIKTVAEKQRAWDLRHGLKKYDQKEKS